MPARAETALGEMPESLFVVQGDLMSDAVLKASCTGS
jgi:hypothetical protein